MIQKEEKDMVSGMYFVTFGSNLGAMGGGLVVVENGKIHGGDFSYLYRGTYSMEGNSMKSKIQVSHYQGPIPLCL